METDFQAYLCFHCPRWRELPELDLYMDQVVSVLERDLALFRETGSIPDDPDKDKKEKDKKDKKEKEKAREENHLITPTMINNYVKHKIIAPPVRKRYSRDHLAYLHIICLGKRLLTMNEIRDVLMAFRDNFTVEQVYDLFCDEIEQALRTAFNPTSTQAPPLSEAPDAATVVLSAFARAFAYKTYAQCMLEQGRLSIE